MTRKTWLSWSSGKDSAWSLKALRSSGAEVAALFTTVNAAFDRVAMHAVRRALVEAQAGAAGLDLHLIEIPYPCPNADYERIMGAFVGRARAEGVEAMAFGDLFLADIRAYRERQLAGTGIAPLFPLWGRDTRALAHEMIDGGLEAHVTCVDPAKLDRAFAGRVFDRPFLADLPDGVDPCGENGEFHTFVSAGPMFHAPVAVQPGAVTERDGFVFADLIPGFRFQVPGFKQGVGSWHSISFLHCYSLIPFPASNTDNLAGPCPRGLKGGAGRSRLRPPDPTTEAGA